MIWLGNELLYAVWSSVKWDLKLVNVWYAEGFMLQSLTYSENIPELVMIILPMLMSGMSFLGVPWVSDIAAYLRMVLNKSAIGLLWK